MKAYHVQDKTECFWATIVFAETAGKARAIGMHTDCCDGAEFTDVLVKRAPDFDPFYRGNCEMDWYNDDDRKAMVARGWKCWEPLDWECESCCAKDICTHKDGEEDFLW